MKKVLNYGDFIRLNEATQESGDTQSPSTKPPTDKKGNVQTWGGLRAMIQSLITKKKLDAAKSGAVNILVDQVVGLIPGASNVKTAFDFFKSIYTADDNKKTNTWIDKLNVDDKYSEIVDDSVEDQFVKHLVKMLEDKPAEEKLPNDFNINNELINYLSKQYDNRSLAYLKK
jgi:hypothetical protein